MVARLVRDQEVACSSHVTSTKKERRAKAPSLFFVVSDGRENRVFSRVHASSVSQIDFSFRNVY